MEIQATSWMAQLIDGTKIRGGQSTLFPDDVSISAVPVEEIKTFRIGHNTFAHTYHAPTGTWYINGKVWVDRPETIQYQMQDQTLITVSMAGGVLALS